MFHSFLIGLIANSSLVIGGLINSWFSLSRKTLGIIIEFGVCVLIVEVAYELTCEY